MCTLEARARPSICVVGKSSSILTASTLVGNANLLNLPNDAFIISPDYPNQSEQTPLQIQRVPNNMRFRERIQRERSEIQVWW